jgi:GAF domain-containing protein
MDVLDATAGTARTSTGVGDRPAASGPLGRGPERQPDLYTVLRAVVRRAGATDLGDAVGVLMVTGRRITVGPASDPEVRRAGELQLECGQGPGVESILTGRSFIADDLRLDSRWRFWGPLAADAGWLSVLSVPLSDGRSFGALSVYSRQVLSYSAGDLAVAQAFAEQAVGALTIARPDRDLVTAGCGSVDDRFGGAA